MEYPGRHVREIADRSRIGDLDRPVVDLAIPVDIGVAGYRNRRVGRIELRRVLLEIAVEVPDRGIGVPIGAVVEFDALAQVEDPFGPVRFVLFPALCQAGTDVGELVGARQIPRRKAFEHRKAEKAQALAAIVGGSGRGRHVGRRHRDPQGAAGPGRAGKRQDCRCGQPERRRLFEEHRCPPIACRPW